MVGHAQYQPIILLSALENLDKPKYKHFNLLKNKKKLENTIIQLVSVFQVQATKTYQDIKACTRYKK